MDRIILVILFLKVPYAVAKESVYSDKFEA